MIIMPANVGLFLKKNSGWAEKLFFFKKNKHQDTWPLLIQGGFEF